MSQRRAPAHSYISQWPVAIGMQPLPSDLSSIYHFTLYIFFLFAMRVYVIPRPTHSFSTHTHLWLTIGRTQVPAAVSPIHFPATLVAVFFRATAHISLSLSLSGQKNCAPATPDLMHFASTVIIYKSIRQRERAGRTRYAVQRQRQVRNNVATIQCIYFPSHLAKCQ